MVLFRHLLGRKRTVSCLEQEKWSLHQGYRVPDCNTCLVLTRIQLKSSKDFHVTATERDTIFSTFRSIGNLYTPQKQTTAM